MKKILSASLLLSLIFLASCLSCLKKKHPVATNKTSTIDSTKLPAYLRTKNMPVIKMLLDVHANGGKQDSVWFTNDSLPVNRPVVIVYFSPECSHCIHEMKEIEKNIDSLKNAFFVFVSRFPIDSIKNFEKKFNTGVYPNMVFGKEATYYIPVFFDIKFTPFMAIYDSKKQYVKSYDQGANMHELNQLIATLTVENVIDKKRNKKHKAK